MRKIEVGFKTRVKGSEFPVIKRQWVKYLFKCNHVK